MKHGISRETRRYPRREVFSGGLRGLVLAAFTAFLAAFPQTASAEREVPESHEQIMLSFAPVVKEVAPAVVNIYTTRTVRQRGISPLFDDPFFKRFFGDRFNMPERQRKQNSLGSGVIVDKDGLVVTNHHVIDGAEEITVVLADKREFEAQVVLADERTDLAVLEIEDAPELPALALRNSDDLEVGDLVLAIGNPFGVGQTVTSGIVSGLARTQVGVADFGFFIQTDAAINPGNSGGALVTLDGRLIGVNSAIYSRSGGSNGIGFAIPSNMVRTVVASAKAGGRLVRPWPGLTGQTLTSDLAEGLRFERPGGVLVNEVYPGGPAATAGLKRGDVIRAVDGHPVDDMQGFRFRIATARIGDTSDLTVFRRGREMRLDLSLEQAPEIPPRNETAIEGRNPLSGAVIANLSPAVAEELELSGRWEGVVIMGVRSRTTAARFRLQRGDIILAVNDREIMDVGDLESSLAEAESGWDIKIERDGRISHLRIGG